MGTVCAEVRRGEDPSEVLDGLRRRHAGLVIQLISMRRPPSPLALAMIGAQTLRARENRELLAEKAELDLLLRIAGTTQIAEAVGRIGYRVKGKRFLVAVGAGGEVAKLRSEVGGGLLIEGKQVSSGDLDLVERAALLAVDRG